MADEQDRDRLRNERFGRRVHEGLDGGVSRNAHTSGESWAAAGDTPNRGEGGYGDDTGFTGGTHAAGARTGGTNSSTNAGGTNAGGTGSHGKAGDARNAEDAGDAGTSGSAKTSSGGASDSGGVLGSSGGIQEGRGGTYDDPASAAGTEAETRTGAVGRQAPNGTE